MKKLALSIITLLFINILTLPSALSLQLPENKTQTPSLPEKPIQPQVSSSFAALGGIGGGGGIGEDEPDPVFPVGDIQSRYNSLNLDILDDSLAGDHIDLDSGSLSFNQIDVSLPGNSSLPVQFGRALNRSTHRTGMIGNWSPDIPYISRHYTQVAGQYLGRNLNRCTGPLYPDTKEIMINGQWTFLRAEAYFSGVEINIPGQNPGKLAQARGSSNAIYSPEFSSTGARLVTKENWFVDCISSIPAGGEGFKAHSPNGITYEFTHKVDAYSRDLEFGDATFPISAEILYVTKITDVHGNWVRFQYSGKNLTRIWSNDERELTFSYSGGKLYKVKANGREWAYSYSGGNLSRVTLPDGRYWTFTSSSYQLAALNPLTTKDICFKMTLPEIQVRHPSGTTIKYQFESIQNGRKDVIFRQEIYPWTNNWLNIGTPVTPPNQSIFDCADDGDVRSKLPSAFWSIAVTQKQLLLPDGEVHTWHREYQEDLGSYDYPSHVAAWAPYNANISATKRRTVTDPEGNKTVTYINRTFGHLEGQIEKIEIIPAEQTIPLRTTDFTYSVGNIIGLTLGARDHGYAGADVTRVYKTSEIVKQDGDTFTSEMGYITNATSSSFSYGFATQIRTKSNVSTTARVVDTIYEHNKNKWILGLVKKVTQNGRVNAEYQYDSNGLKQWYKRYGALYAKYGYHSNGTLAWAEDDLVPARRTEAHNWKGGTPQKVIRPDGSEYSQNVDDNGWITSMTDPMGYTDTYTLDSMGRVTHINPHGAWANTTISYSFPSAGGATQTITTGQSRITVTYDGLYRPILERTQALDTNWSSYLKTQYDGLGREVFKSQPFLSLSHSEGFAFTYDALGRIKTETETAINAVTEHHYYGSHRHRVIDPSNAWTDYYSYGYDGPDNQNYRAIYNYESNGANLQKTYLYKNVHGQLTRLRQWGNSNGISVDYSHYLYYDAQQRVCRYYTPETGATIFKYNAAYELIRYAKGQSNSGCSVPNNNTRVSLTYDLLGQSTGTIFSDVNTPSNIKTYDDNGNLKTVSRGSGSAAVNWTYSYNDADLLTHEVLTVDGRTFPISYEYNNAKHMTRRNYPNGFYTDSLPDGLGRAQIAKYGATYYASAATFHANGSIKTVAYGNGQNFTQTLNNRLLPQRLLATDGIGKALDLNYTYDSRANVTSIIDGAMSGNNRFNNYDGLGRLVSASGPWGSGSIEYDAIGNTHQRTLGSRSITINYDTSKNRVSQSIDTGSTGNRLMSYDSRGNTTGAGALQMNYDFSEQLTSISGFNNSGTAINGLYTYDGNGKRVKSVVNGKTIYNVYDLSGSLVHVHELAANGQPETRTDYVKLGAMAVARIENKSTPIYTFSDVLGSPVASQKNDGSIERERYTPFGIAMDTPSSLEDQAGFTGHINDSATGLVYMQARYYDPLIGRFYSNDPKGASEFLAEGKIHGFNRYVYAANNPYKYVDPDGRDYKEKYISLKIPFVGAVDVGVVDFSPNSAGEGNTTSGVFLRVGTSAANVDSDSGKGAIKQRGAIAGLTLGMGEGSHTDQNFDEPSATLDMGVGVGTISIGDMSSDESSASVEIGPSIGLDGTVSKSFTLTGEDVKNTYQEVKTEIKELFN